MVWGEINEKYITEFVFDYVEFDGLRSNQNGS